jgi:hypothetical protein
MTSPNEDQSTIRLTLDVLRVPGPITGAVLGPNGAREFCGWTALASAIDRALAGSATAGDQPSVVADRGQ